MGTAETHDPPGESVGTPKQTPRANHPTARFRAQGVVFLVTVVAFAAGTFFLLALIFGLFFNAVTIHLTFFAFGVLAFLHGFTEYRNRLTVSGTATATANSAAIGLVELSGRGYAEHSSESPVTKKLCAYWKVEVRHRGKNDFRFLRAVWNRVMERSSGCPETYELEDDTGRVLVWARGAEMIPIKQVWRSNRDTDPPEGVLRLITTLGLEWPKRWARFPMMVTEERIEQGGPLYVMGTLAERRQIPEASSGRFAAFMARWAPSDPPQPQGESYAGVFNYARTLGVRWILKDFRSVVPVWCPPVLDLHQVLVWKGDQRRPFIISGVLERQALRALSTRAWLYLLGGAGLMAWMLWEFLDKLTGNMHW
jgi:hypothetical protein